jgi:hypothetical protein
VEEIDKDQSFKRYSRSKEISLVDTDDEDTDTDDEVDSAMKMTKKTIIDDRI